MNKSIVKKKKKGRSTSRRNLSHLRVGTGTPVGVRIWRGGDVRKVDRRGKGEIDYKIVLIKQTRTHTRTHAKRVRRKKRQVIGAPTHSFWCPITGPGSGGPHASR